MFRLMFATLLMLMCVPCLAEERGSSEGRASGRKDPFAPPQEATERSSESRRRASVTESPPERAPAEPEGRRREGGRVSERAAVSPSPSTPAGTPAACAARARIEAELAKNTSFEYLNEQLRDVVEDIGFRHQIPVRVDLHALEDYELTSDLAITIDVRDVTLRSALRLMLAQHELTYAIRDEVLMITTREQADKLLATKLYPVSETMNTAGNAEYLVALIETHVDSPSWERFGGPGKISYVDHLEALVISQRDDLFPEIESLLAIIRQLAAERQARRSQ